MTTRSKRLIEDYIAIEAISAEARREKSIRKGYISTLHLWWARRPLVAARAGDHRGAQAVGGGDGRAVQMKSTQGSDRAGAPAHLGGQR